MNRLRVPAILFSSLFFSAGVPARIQAQIVTAVYFNRSPHSDNLPKIFSNWIAGAVSRLDAHFYDLIPEDPSVMGALRTAALRGVKIRLLTDADNWETSLNGLISFSTNIELWNDSKSQGSGSSGRESHNKFAIRDNGEVWTGSWNADLNGYIDNAQNAFILSHCAITAAYRDEFNTMWGGTNHAFDADNALFGTAKSGFRPGWTNASAGGEYAEVFFSPINSGGRDPVSSVCDLIAAAQNHIHFCIFTFTHPRIITALSNRARTGIPVYGVLDHFASNTSALAWSSLSVIPHCKLVTDRVDGTLSMTKKLHHKYLICDAGVPGARQTVVTGSANWTVAAFEQNDENMLIIDSAAAAHKYFGEFHDRYAEAGGGGLKIPPDIGLTAAWTHTRILTNAALKIISLNVNTQFGAVKTALLSLSNIGIARTAILSPSSDSSEYITELTADLPPRNLPLRTTLPLTVEWVNGARLEAAIPVLVTSSASSTLFSSETIVLSQNPLRGAAVLIVSGADLAVSCLLSSPDGRPVRTFTLTSLSGFSFAEQVLPSGVYLLELLDSEGNRVRKPIIYQAQSRD